MLILAGVVLTLTIGENGIINIAKDTKIQKEISDIKEKIQVEILSKQTENEGSMSENNLEKILLEYGKLSEEEKIIDKTLTTYEGNYNIKVSEIYNDVTKKQEVLNVNVSIKNILGESVIITKENLGDYLGKEVKYIPTNPSAKYVTSKTYRIFYIDFDNKYKDGVGTIYLKADNAKKGYSLREYAEYESNNIEIMKKLNPLWVDVQEISKRNENEKCISWILNETEWEGWKDINLNKYINYVVGSPTLEMYIDSYNIYLDSHSNVKLSGSETLAKKLDCEYAYENGFRGYIVGFKEENKEDWQNKGYFQDNNSIISSDECNGMYSYGGIYPFCLASPSKSYTNMIMCVQGGNANKINCHQTDAIRSFSPLVSLKCGTILELVE